MEIDKQFTDEFIQAFTENGFYAAPNRTKIHVKLDGKDSLIGNAVVASLEQTNEKIPIYSYNSPTYNKYLNGRQIVTGKIGLRKITVAQFIRMLIKDKNIQSSTTKIMALQEEIKKLEKLILDHTKQYLDSKYKKPDGLYAIMEAKKTEIKMLNNLIKNNNKASNLLYEMEGLKDGKTDALFKNDDLLYYLDKTSGDNRLKIVINFENGTGDTACPYIALKDVLFIRKQTEINVGRGDIIEFYDFIGNPSFERS